MKGTRKEYEKIDYKGLKGAKTIKNYAKEEGIEVASVYRRFQYGKINIVEFEGINFVLPVK